MSIETPDHWGSETKRYAQILQRRTNDDPRLEEGLLAIAVEIAELRNALKPWHRIESKVPQPAESLSSPGANWQRRMMAVMPDICWVFVAPATVCVAEVPCPRHPDRSGI